MALPHDDTAGAHGRGTPGEVFAAFGKLGLTSFGGPVAHLGYFREELVVRRRWIDEAGYGELVALCQFLPGPASSQVGFALGLMRAGPLGALAAWSAFTLPSAILLVLFAHAATVLDNPVGAGLLQGLKLVAVAIVAQAVWGMARALAPDLPRAGIAGGAIAVVVLAGGTIGQVAAIAAGGLAGLWLSKVPLAPRAGSSTPVGFGTSPAVGATALILAGLLLIGLPIAASVFPGQATALVDSFYRAGALVFGGGHVVLPLLQAEVVAPGWIGEDAFLAGYGAAQAVPGPLFTFGAYLGAAMVPEPNGLIGALICLVAIFLPGLLLLVGALPYWDALRRRPMAQAAMRGANAAVVGILAAALYDPVFTSAVQSPFDLGVAAAGFALLVLAKAPPWIVVVLVTAAGAGLHVLVLP